MDPWLALDSGGHLKRSLGQLSVFFPQSRKCNQEVLTEQEKRENKEVHYLHYAIRWEGVTPVL